MKLFLKSSKETNTISFSFQMISTEEQAIRLHFQRHILEAQIQQVRM
jgi:hypothetical protein